MLLKCCQLFQNIYQQCPLTRQEVEATYKTILLPTITYPLPATTLSETILKWAQSMTTPVILRKMGYNWNMPKAVIYTPTLHGGIWMKNLHTEQGVQQVLQLVKHLQDQTHLGNLFSHTIKAYQIAASITNPILENTSTLPWMLNKWLTNLWQVLNKIEGLIYLQDPWFIQLLRQHSHHLMEDFLDARYPTNNLQTLNNCQMHLQVTTLAEITNHTMKAAKHIPTDNKQIHPQMATHQLNSAKAAWSLWTQASQKLYTKPRLPNQLNHSLRPWKSTASCQNLELPNKPWNQNHVQKSGWLNLPTPLQWTIWHHTYYQPLINPTQPKSTTHPQSHQSSPHHPRMS